jgi:hypothetical protein
MFKLDVDLLLGRRTGLKADADAANKAMVK